MFAVKRSFGTFLVLALSLAVGVVCSRGLTPSLILLGAIFAVFLGIMSFSNKYLVAITSTYFLFVFTFPKAGLKLADSPIVISSLILGMALFSFGLIFMRQSRMKMSYTITTSLVQKYMFFSGIALSLMMFYSFTQNGLIGSLTRFIPVYLPILTTMFLYFVYYDKPEKLSKTFFITFSLTAIYGVAQYLFGHYAILIPGLTVNYSDYQEFGNQLFEMKMNVTAVGLKLVGTFQNGNLFGCVMIVGVLILTGWFLSNAFTSRKQRIIYALILLSSLFCVMMSLSRSALLGVALGLMALSLLYLPMLKYFIGVLAAIVVSVFAFGLQERIFANDPTGAGRTFQYQDFFSHLAHLSPMDKVLFLSMGKGIGYNPSPQAVGVFTNVESSLLNLILYSGLIGLAIYFFPVVYGVMSLLKIRKEKTLVMKKKRDIIQLVSIISALIGMWGQMAIDQLLNLPPTGFIYWIIVTWMFIKIREINYLSNKLTT
ncbi:O-antigen ligase [Paenibacillus sp. XY044]|uniref:O-antigen ligase family protein n=1 Tax=Paenibacillus sp. XY044 TaxID=2026089 RepID=UPI000B9814FD|nr:O-antigen ligase family protein [Paenibacillus sp. XY044]OZB98013.1 hypothetical protein CJP46_02280 [Paenibacillus sp. XY044]